MPGHGKSHKGKGAKKAPMQVGMTPKGMPKSKKKPLTASAAAFLMNNQNKF